MTGLGDEQGLEVLARTVQHVADESVRVNLRLLHRAQDVPWHGPAARRTLDRAAERLEDARHQADRLHDLADQLRRNANRVRAAEEDIRSAERAVRWWAYRNPAGRPGHQGPDASWVRWWPPADHIEWIRIRAELRRYGAWC